MRFKCTFEARDKDPDTVRHEVVWYTGPPEKQVDKEILKGDRNEAYLQNTNKYGQKPKFCLNKNVSLYKDVIKRSFIISLLVKSNIGGLNF